MLKNTKMNHNPKPKFTLIFTLLLLFAACSSCRADPSPPLLLPTTPTAASVSDSTLHPSPGPSSTTKQTTPTPKDTTDKLYTTSGIRSGKELNIYADPGSASRIIDRIPAGAVNIQGTGKLENSGDTIWVQVTYRGLKGWVNQDFITVQQGAVPSSLSKLSNRILYLIKDKRFQELSALIHPQECLRFSPYPYLKPDNLIFCPEDFNDLITASSQYRWGQFDGSGKPIDLTFEKYYQQFIYDQDYVQAETVGFNQEVSSGNSPNNISEIYPGAVFVEYHFPEIDPQYGGLDWRSLRLVFKEIEGKWYLLAVVHGEWTI